MSSIFIFDENRKIVRLKEVEIFPNHLKVIQKGEEHILTSMDTLEKFLFGDLLLMQIHPDRKLVPLARKKIYADPLQNPYLKSSVKRIKNQLSSGIMDYKKLLFEAQTSTLNKSALQTHLLKLSTLNETYSDFSIQKLLDLNSELKIVDVNYNNIYLQHIQIPITLISPQSKFKVKIRGYFDSGSSICLISPNLVRKLELKASGVINIRTVNATSTSKIVDLEYKLEAQPRNSKKKLSIHHTTQAAVLENMSDSFAGLEFVLSVDIFNYVKNKYNINITDLSKK